MADVSKIKIKGNTYNLKDSEARSAIAALPSSMIFKGTLGTNGTITTLPTASSTTVGYVYKVITDGTYASISAKVGDMFICSDVPEWTLVPSGDEPSGTVTNIATGNGLTGGPITTSGTISLADSGVKAGTYQGITVDSTGRVTNASNMGYTTNTGTITGITMNGISKGTSGTIDLGTVVTVVDTALSSTSTNPVQNKVINTALNNKADSAIDNLTSTSTTNALSANQGKQLESEISAVRGGTMVIDGTTVTFTITES